MLRLGTLDVPDGRFVVMAIVNRTPDSFYDRGATFELAAAASTASRRWSPRVRTWWTSAA